MRPEKHSTIRSTCAGEGRKNTTPTAVSLVGAEGVTSDPERCADRLRQEAGKGQAEDFPPPPSFRGREAEPGPEGARRRRAIHP
ncbi:hypothetical protein JCM2811A_38570 [Methylorubrum rhodinum]